MAKNLWRQLDGLSEADRRFVHNALQRRLTPKVQLGNQEIAIAGLQRFDLARRTAHAKMGTEELPRWADGNPSKRSYNAFRDAQPDRSNLPSTTLIANAFQRRWGDALAAAGLGVAPNVRAGRGLNQSKPFDVEEVKAALGVWIAQVGLDGPLIQAEYVAWIKRESRASNTRFPTLPTVMKYLGTWGEALTELGLLERHPDVLAASRRIDDSPRAKWAARIVESLDLGSLPKRTRTKSSEDVAEWLRWMAAPLSKERRAGLDMDEWDILRAALIVRLASLGKHAAIPSAKGIKMKSDDRSWPMAKRRAGILDGTCSSHCSPTTRAFDDDELIDAVASSAGALGRLPTQSEYEAYRLAAREAGSRLPSTATIRTRIGASNSWASVLEQLSAERPRLELGGKSS